MESAPVFHPTRSKYILITTDYLLPLAICLGIIALGYLALFSPFFQIKTVTCTLDYQVCTDPSLLVELENQKGQNILRFRPERLESRLTSADFTVREAVITRSLPDTLNVQLQSVYPAVALKIVGEDTWIVLDPTLRVIGKRTSDPNVPAVIVPGTLTVTVGKRPEGDSVIKALELTLRLSSELVEVKTLTLVDDNTIEILLPTGLRALFTPRDDEVRQLRALQAVLADATILSGVRIIDVRFSQPVLR